jgi:glycosyltransferase involved in cell wall biosynthesis
MSQTAQKPKPTISVVIAAYQAESFIAEALGSIVAQTRQPDEILVIDDGSSDATVREIESFGERIRLIRQSNHGYQATMNRAIAEASGDYVALCGADDIWEPQKLGWQEQAIRAHPEAEVFFGHALAFGSTEAELPRPPGEGVLDAAALRSSLLRQNVIATPFIVMRRSLFERLGWFEEDFVGDDYDYWFRCLSAGVRFYYDPRLLGHYRRHDGNITKDAVRLYRAMNTVRLRYADTVEDRRLLGRALAIDYFKIARMLLDEGRLEEARLEFRRALGCLRADPATAARALVWLGILGLPRGLRERSGRILVGLSRSIDAVRGTRRPVSS